MQKVLETDGSYYGRCENSMEYHPELNGKKRKLVETTRIVQDPGSVNPYSYPCRHAWPCDLGCWRRAMSHWNLWGRQPERAMWHRLSLAPEVTGLHVATWVRVGVNRARVLYNMSSFYEFPLLSIEFWIIYHTVLAPSVVASVCFQYLPCSVIV
jgi:hypothetical protein